MITPPEGGPRKATKMAKPRPAVVPRPPRSAPATVKFGNSQSLVQLAEKLAREAMQPDKSSLELQRKQSAAQAQANAATQQAMLAIAQKYLSPLAGQIQGGFNTAADAQAGFGKGYAIGQQLATQGNADTANAAMQSIGAPEGQQISGDVAQAAADVLNATGGQIPADMFRSQGEGYAQAAAAYPKMADARYQGVIDKIMADANMQDSDFASQIAELEKQYPDLQTKYLLQLQEQQYQQEQDSKQQAMSLYNAGFLSQRDLAKTLGLPNWQQFPNSLKDSGAAAARARLTFKVAGDGTLVGIDPYTGKIVSQTPHFGAGQAGRQSNLTFKNINGHMWAIDPMTGQKVSDLGRAGSPKGKGSQAKPTYRQGADGRTYLIDPATNSAIPVEGLPGKTPKAGSGRFTPNQILQFKGTAETIARNAFNGFTDGKGNVHRPLHYQQAMAEMRSEGIPLAIAQKALNHYWTKPGYERDIGQLTTKGRIYWYRSRGTGEGRPVNPKVSAAGQAAVKGRVPKNQAAKYIVGEAQKWLGTPYSWGGGGPGGPSYGTGRGANTKGFDCSAFVQYLYSKYGVNLPRTTYDQIKSGYSVKGQGYQPGDLIFFGTPSDPHHVGMYIGGGKFIESPYTGSHIKITSLSSRSDIVDVRRIFT